jgi:hypothetical protein
MHGTERRRPATFLHKALTISVRRTTSKPAKGEVMSNELAKGLVERIGLFEAHRGVVPVRDGVLVVFGNDGYSSHDDDHRAREEVAALRRMLVDMHAEELGFATTDDGLLVRPEQIASTAAGLDFQVALFTAILWRAWRAAFLVGEGLET